MDKHCGKYYLQYAAPGTQFNAYSDGEALDGSMTACPLYEYSTIYEGGQLSIY